MGTYIIRHGDAGYQQGKVNISMANDLTENGVDTVNKTALHLSNTIESEGNSQVQLYSSPFGRCLHTSRIVRDVLASRGSDIKPIQITNDLEEVRNFEWNLFYPLVVGGELKYNGDAIAVDVDLTNPQRDSPTRYFRGDLVHKLSKTARDSLPKSYLERINQFERYPSVTSRLSSWLAEHKNNEGIELVVCTHEGLTGDLIEQVTRNKEAYLQRGKYFAVKNENGIFVPYISQDNSVSTQ